MPSAFSTSRKLRPDRLDLGPRPVRGPAPSVPPGPTRGCRARRAARCPGAVPTPPARHRRAAPPGEARHETGRRRAARRAARRRPTSSSAASASAPLGVGGVEVHERRAQLGALERDRSPEPPERRLGEREVAAGAAAPAARRASPATDAGRGVGFERLHERERAAVASSASLERRPPTSVTPRHRGRADRPRRSTAPSASVAGTRHRRSNVTAWPCDSQPRGEVGAHAPRSAGSATA